MTVKQLVCSLYLCTGSLKSAGTPRYIFSGLIYRYYTSAKPAIIPAMLYDFLSQSCSISLLFYSLFTLRCQPLFFIMQGILRRIRM